MGNGLLVAVSGSAKEGRTDYEPKLQDASGAKAAAELLGAALAEAGHRLLVFSLAEEYIERWVVDGYLGSGKAKPGSVRVLYANGQHGDHVAVYPRYTRHKKHIVAVPDTESDWEISFYRSLGDVDAMLLVGGARSTLAAGILSLEHRKPVIALSCFGGASATVWRLAERYDHIPPGAHQLMGQPIDRHIAKKLAAGLALPAPTRASVVPGSRQAAASLVAAVAAVVCGIASPAHVWAFWACFSLTALLAGVSGALTQEVRALSSREPDSSPPPPPAGWRASALKGAVAGVATAFLFAIGRLAFLWTGVGATPLQPPGTWARILTFGGVLVVGLIAGLAADKVLSKLARTQVVNTTPLGPIG